MQINSLTFFGNSSIINAKKDMAPVGALNPNDVKKDFLKMLLEKIYLKDFKMTLQPNEEDNQEEGNEFGFLSEGNIGDTVVNELFRQQIADVMIQNDAFQLGDELERK